MTATEYNLHPGISPSSLRKAVLYRADTIAESTISMLHMRHAMMSTRDEVGSAAMQWGTLCHAALLQPGTVRVWDGDGSKATKAYKKFRAALPASIHLVTEAERAKLDAVVDAVWANADARYILEGATVEQPLSWTSETIGACKGKPDAYNRETVADIKVMKDCTEHAINAAIHRGLIDVQLAWYARGIAECTGKTISRHVVIAIETTPPHAVTVATIRPQFIDAALTYAWELANVYRVHERCNSFPGPTSGRMEYEPPKRYGDDWAPEETTGDDAL